MNFNKKVVVIDNGSGYTKMGYAGNTQPSFEIPTLIAETAPTSNSANWSGRSRISCDTLDFTIGQQARQLYRSHKVVNPMEGGVVSNWDLMQKFWHRSIFDYLRCDPQETVFVFSEPLLNAPENRERMAEVMFETFNVKGLYIGLEPIFTLISSLAVNYGGSYRGTVVHSGDGVTYIIPVTGVVVDSGDRVTSIVPVVDGFINNCIKPLPFGGSTITNFIFKAIRQRNQRCPVEEANRIARFIKQKYSYVVESGDLLREMQNFDNRMVDQKLRKKFDRYIEGIDTITRNPYKVSIGPERFLAPEIFFNPQIIDEKYRRSVDYFVDTVVQLSPIGARRELYANIALSGGSTLFKGLNERLERRVKQRVQQRLSKYERMSGQKSHEIEVKVLDSDPYQKNAVWLGGSMLAGGAGFQNAYHRRSDYFQKGSSICRQNAVLSSSFY